MIHALCLVVFLAFGGVLAGGDDASPGQLIGVDADGLSAPRTWCTLLHAEAVPGVPTYRCDGSCPVNSGTTCRWIDFAGSDDTDPEASCYCSPDGIGIKATPKDCLAQIVNPSAGAGARTADSFICTYISCTQTCAPQTPTATYSQPCPCQ